MTEPDFLSTAPVIHLQSPLSEKQGSSQPKATRDGDGGGRVREEMRRRSARRRGCGERVWREEKSSDGDTHRAQRKKRGTE